MYLIAIFTLIVSLLGIYGQVVAVQSARILANQSGIGQTMQHWHRAALSMAASIIKTNAAGYAAVAANGCSLGYIIPAGAPIGRCPTPVLKGGATDAAGGTVTTATPNPQLTLVYLPNASNPSIANECVHLPSQCVSRDANGCTSCTAYYDTTNYQFYSVLYQSASGQNLVITFVPAAVITASNPAPGFVMLANANLVNVTSAGLILQLQKSGAPNYTYGSINSAGNTFTVSGNNYTLPGSFASMSNIAGAVGVVGSPDGF